MEAAPALSDAVGWQVTTVLTKFSSLLEAWAKRVGLGKELKSLNKELATIDSILCTYSKCLTQLQTFHLFRDLLYMADDLVDELEYCRVEEEIVSSGSGEDSEVISSFSSKSSWACKLLCKFRRTSSSSSSSSCVKGNACNRAISKRALANRINGLARLVQQDSNHLRNALKYEKFDAIAILNWKTQSVKSVQTMTSLSLSESRVFGRDKNRDYLINLLTGRHKDADSDVSVIPIVGSGGVGKTTLAKLVYNDSIVKSHFDVHMWITSFGHSEDEFGNTGVVLANNGQVKIEKLEVLPKKLADSLKSKKFLLVMDDLCIKNEFEWELLLAPLKQISVKGSKILITTRVFSIAKIVRSSETIFINGLGNEEFSNFFYWRIYNTAWYRSKKNFEIIGRLMRKLEGRPLASKVVTAFLKRDTDKAFWWRVEREEEWNVEDDILPALKLGYKYLPTILKQCFKFFALFPKGYPLEREDMINMWTALGFIDSKGRRNEDIASEYFDFLVDHGFLDRVCEDNPSIYVMHDLVHDLAKHVSSDEYLISNSLLHKNVYSNTRYMSIIPKSCCLELGFIESKLRALIFLDNNEDSEQENVLEERIKLGLNLKSLRVLTLNATLSNSLSNFTNLRYLKLNLDLEILPRYICKLYHLLTLDISNCKKLHELPKKFNNLINLRHFIADERIHSMIADVSKLSSLQELREFHVKNERSFSVEQLKNLKEIRGSLKICNLVNVKSKEEAIEARLIEKFLNCLSLSWDIDRKRPDFRDLQFHQEEVIEGLKPNLNLKTLNIIGYGGVKLPSWLLLNNITTSLVNLECIYLKDCSNLETLPPLGELPFLKELHIKSLNKVYEIGLQLYGRKPNLGFKYLQILVIEDLVALETWHWVNEKKWYKLFQALRTLKIKNCPKLRMLPFSNWDSIKCEKTVRFGSLNSLVINECPNIEKLPFLPFTSTLSHISINKVGDLLGEFYLSVFRGELEVKIYNNHKVRTLDELLGFCKVGELRSLCIKRCPKLRSIRWEKVCSLVLLNSLYIEECPEIISFFKSRYMSFLAKLEIINCRNLRTLPSNLHRLNELTIKGCESIQIFAKNDLQELN